MMSVVLLTAADVFFLSISCYMGNQLQLVHCLLYKDRVHISVRERWGGGGGGALSEPQAYLTFVLKFLGSFSNSLFIKLNYVIFTSTSSTTWERGGLPERFNFST